MRDMFRRPGSALERWLVRIGQLSLQKRLFIIYILIILLPGVLISVPVFNQLSHKYLEDVRKTNITALEFETVNIARSIETMERAAQLAVSDKDILYYLEQTSEPNTSELIDFNRNAVANLLRLQYNNPNVEHIRLYAESPFVIEIWPVFIQASRIRGEPWYEKVRERNGKELWTFDRQDRDPILRNVDAEKVNRPKISLLREIEYPIGRDVGIMQIDMLLANFFPNTFRDAHDGQSQMFVVDGDGRFYYDASSPFLNRTGLSTQQLASRLESREPGVHSVTFTAGNRPFLCAYVYNERIGAYLMRVASLENALAAVNQTRNGMLAVILGLFAVLSAATYFLLSYILKKLRVLTESMKKVRQGDFNFDLSIKGGGEVGELAHHFRKMLKKINELIAEAVTKNAATKEAELKSLKNQIDSHFLYNTLENIKMLAEIENQPAISDALTSLGGMMRYNLQWTSEYVPLRDELNHIANYAAIMNIRFAEKIVIVNEIPDMYLDRQLLKMSLQPIIENAVQHGAAPSRKRDLTVTLRARTEGDAMIIELTDDGAGMPEQKVEALNRMFAEDDPERSAYCGQRADRPARGGIGLRNVNQRMKLFYGKAYGLRAESKEGEYTRICMSVPNIDSGGEL